MTLSLPERSGRGGRGGPGGILEFVPQVGYGGFSIGPAGVQLDVGPFGGTQTLAGFQGIPAGAKTQRAVDALRLSNIPALRTLASEIEAFKYAGGDLATGNAADRARLGQFVHQAVGALESLGLDRKTAFNRISNALSYGSPVVLPNLVAKHEAAVAEASTKYPTNPMSFLTSGQEFVQQFSNRLPLFGAGVGAAIGGFEAGLKGAAIGGVEGYQAGKEAQTIIDKLFGQPGQVEEPPFISQGGGSPTSGISPMPLVGQGGFEPVPHIGDCPECGYISGDLRNQLTQQRDDLMHEIEVEQQQGTKQIVDQQGQDIQHFKDLENIPPGQPTQPGGQPRDIPRELAQKQNLLNEINNQLAGQPILNLPPGVGPGQGPQNPPGLGQPTQQIPSQGQEGPIFIQKPPPPEMPPQPATPVRFCVTCTSQNESLKFLNGEPSECSVESAS